VEPPMFFFWKRKTIVAKASLCDACRYSTIAVGYNQGEKAVVCRVNYGTAAMIPFAVDECSGFVSKHIPTIEELEQMAKA
jgi:hypothetical protein